MIKYLGLKKKNRNKERPVLCTVRNTALLQTLDGHNFETKSDRQILITPLFFGQQPTYDEIKKFKKLCGN